MWRGQPSLQREYWVLLAGVSGAAADLLTALEHVPVNEECIANRLLSAIQVRNHCGLWLERGAYSCESTRSELMSSLQRLQSVIDLCFIVPAAQRQALPSETEPAARQRREASTSESLPAENRETADG